MCSAIEADFRNVLKPPNSDTFVYLLIVVIYPLDEIVNIQLCCKQLNKVIAGNIL